MEKIEMICINCPLGCALTVERDGENFKVSGNREGAYLPVKTSKPISKSKLFEAMALVNATKAQAPVKIGDVIIANMLGEADLVAASDAE